MRGVIKTLKPDAGYGFIKTTDNAEHFFNRSGCITPFDQLKSGIRVEFEPEASPKGNRGTNVVAIS